MGDLYPLVVAALQERRPVALATLMTGAGAGRKLLVWPDEPPVGSLVTQTSDASSTEVSEVDAEVVQVAKHLLSEQRADRISVTAGPDTFDIFVDVFVPPPVLMIVGAVHIAIPLVTFAKTLGFRTIVLDARSAFATEARFGHADELILGWPADHMAEIGIDNSTYVVVLTHDEKIDNPALVYALQHPARYIGALGARKTHARRVAALQEMGVDQEALTRIHAPIGLNLGGRRPEEIALAIMAEIVAVQNHAQT